MTWAVAPSLVAMAVELDRLFPKRSKASDGTIGDQSHANRTSDHNPGARNLVHARDVTHDPANGCDCNQLVGALIARQDPRLRYAIWDGQIYRSYPRAATRTRDYVPAWHPEPYSGLNPHRHHAHFSIHSTVEAEQDTSSWWQQTPMKPEEARMALLAQGTRCVAMASTPAGDGYWLLGDDGSVYTFGNANFYGGRGGDQAENAAFTDIEATPTGQGYWLLGADGSVWAYGDAQFHGSAA